MQNTPSKRLSGNKLLSKIAASRFFTTSLVIHLVLISILGSVVLFKTAQETTVFEVGANDGFLQESEKVEEAQASQEPVEFEEPAAAAVEAPAAPSVQSTISSLTETQTTNWSTPAAFEQMTVGTTLTAAMPIATGATGAGGGGGSRTKGTMGPLGKRSAFSFMGIKSESRRVAFLLDASGSMLLDAKGGGAAYEDLKTELVNLVSQLNPETEFNVIMFDGGPADTFQPQAVPATREHVTALKMWIDPYMRDKAGLLRQNYHKTHLVGASGTTRLDIALEAAFEMQAETIFILTDGTPSVSRVANPEALQKWEADRIKNKAAIDRYEQEMAEYNTKFKAEIEEARKKAAEMNASVAGRTREAYHWTSFAPPRPQAPAGYHRPTEAVSAQDFNEMMKTMQLEYYAPNRMPMPSVNIIGYHVDQAAEDFLKDMTRGIPGKFKSFKN